MGGWYDEWREAHPGLRVAAPRERAALEVATELLDYASWLEGELTGTDELGPFLAEMRDRLAESDLDAPGH